MSPLQYISVPLKVLRLLKNLFVHLIPVPRSSDARQLLCCRDAFPGEASSRELQLPHMVPPVSWHMPVRPWLVAAWRLLHKLMSKPAESSRTKDMARVRI